MATELSCAALLRCWLRSNMVNAAYNLRGLQNLGFTYSMLPGLNELYPEKRAFYAACRRYAVFHNCHTFWGPYLTGAFLHMEKAIAAGAFDPSEFGPLRESILNSFSGIGDSFFSGSLNSLSFLLLALTAGLGLPWLACLIMLVWLLLALLMKVITFRIGLHQGFQAMHLLRRFNLINWGDRLKIAAAFVLLAFLYFSLGAAPGLGMAATLHIWFFPVALLVLFAWLSIKLHYSRSLLLSLLLLLLGLWF